MSQLASDNFIRGAYPENPISGGWSSVAGIAPFEIISAGNATGTDTAQNGSAAIYTGVSFPDDHYSEITIGVEFDSSYYGSSPSVRALTTDFTGYIPRYYYGINGGFIAKYVNSTLADYSDFEMFTTPIAPGDVIRMSASGNVITLLKNGILQITYVDMGTVLVGGSAGIFESGAALDDSYITKWTGGDLLSGGGMNSAGLLRLLGVN